MGTTRSRRPCHEAAPAGRPLQLKIVRVDAGRFGHSGAGSRQEEQKGPVASAAGRRRIGGRDDSVHFRAGQVMRRLDVGSFGRDRQNPLGDAEGSRDRRRRRAGRTIGSRRAGRCAWRQSCSASPRARRERRERGPDRDPRAPTPPAPSANGPRQRGSACAERRDSWPRSRGWRCAAWPIGDGNKIPGAGPDEVLAHAAPPSRKARSAAMARRSDEPVR